MPHCEGQTPICLNPSSCLDSSPIHLFQSQDAFPHPSYLLFTSSFSFSASQCFLYIQHFSAAQFPLSNLHTERDNSLVCIKNHFHLSQTICPYPLGTSYFWDSPSQGFSHYNPTVGALFSCFRCPIYSTKPRLCISTLPALVNPAL